ncbi:MAG: c-type cytochrome [Bacteroidales bacterium]|jgi:mono/diheme cytochrome c family protein
MKNTNWIFALALLGIITITGCKKVDPNQEVYDNASIAKGGILYDNFFSTEAGYDQNSPNLAKFKASSDFFRCKQCHAWDGLGNAGSYINRAPKTSRPNIASVNLYQVAQTKSFTELFDAMKKSDGRRDIAYDLTTYNPSTNAAEGDKMPNLTQCLSDSQIWDIVKFLKEGMFDVSQLYDATYTGVYPSGTVAFTNLGKDGNESNGNAYFAANCAACHGADGTAMKMENMSLGKFVRSKPNEVQHKVKYGQLGSAMPGMTTITLSQMKDLYKACSNSVAFPD